MVNVYIANTDNSWFDFLSAEADLTEVNFWSPGETAFRAIQQGEILAFRLKSPRNKIGGFGIFSSNSRLPIQMAWETFGRANGVSSLEALRSAIANAAHIKPYGEGGLHMKSNGILLRKDIHSVFDAGYATISEDFKFFVSKKVREVFNNGEEYLRLNGKELRRPERKADWPDVDLLRWHNNYRYLG